LSYILPVIFAVTLHALLAFSFLYTQFMQLQQSRQMPRHIQAQMYDIKALSTATKKEETKAKDVELAPEKTPPKSDVIEKVVEETKPDNQQLKDQQAALQEQKKQREVEKEKKALERIKEQDKLKDELAKKEADAKKQQEIESKRKLAAKEKAEQEKAEQEKQRKAEQAKKEQEKLAAKKKAEQDKKRKEEAATKKKAADKKRQLAEKARLKALQQQIAEEEQFAGEQIAKEMASGIDGYIQSRLKGNFRIPSTARNGINAMVRIKLLPSGRVVAVELIQSSGNAAFDRAAEQAVWRTESFPKVADIARTSPAYFNRELRTFKMSFKPEELRW
jgi:colicin import membrane protein